jgi:hypothetical protein
MYISRKRPPTFCKYAGKHSDTLRLRLDPVPTGDERPFIRSMQIVNYVAADLLVPLDLTTYIRLELICKCFKSSQILTLKIFLNKRPMGHIAHLSNLGQYRNIFFQF